MLFSGEFCAARALDEVFCYLLRLRCGGGSRLRRCSEALKRGIGLVGSFGSGRGQFRKAGPTQTIIADLARPPTKAVLLEAVVNAVYLVSKPNDNARQRRQDDDGDCQKIRSEAHWPIPIDAPICRSDLPRELQEHQLKFR